MVLLSNFHNLSLLKHSLSLSEVEALTLGVKKIGTLLSRERVGPLWPVILVGLGLKFSSPNVTPHFPGVPLTTVNLRNTCVSYHETYT